MIGPHHDAGDETPALNLAWPNHPMQGIPLPFCELTKESLAKLREVCESAPDPSGESTARRLIPPQINVFATTILVVSVTLALLGVWIGFRRSKKLGQLNP